MGFAIQNCIKKLIGRRRIPGLKIPGRLDQIIGHLFPRCTPPSYDAIDTITSDIPPFSLDELVAAGLNLPRGKAPGPDGVPDEVLRVIIKTRPELLLPTFNRCLKGCKLFPSWKTATLVLLRKGTKPLEEPSSYRPLCLINSVGKLYERLLKSRLEIHLQSIPDGISERQFGFSKVYDTSY